MSILIKGMEMPKNCDECVMRYVDHRGYIMCELTHQLVKSGAKDRYDDCPLIELPPHGRLIDADAIQDYNVETFGQRLLIIDTAPTVIETEGSE